MRILHQFWWLYFSSAVSILASVSLDAYAQRAMPLPRFAQQGGKHDGWQGGDAAYSIPLSTCSDLWIFGDTLLGADRHAIGRDPRMVHNSLATTGCGANASVSYIIRKDSQRKPVSYFSPTDPTHWYWAMDGVKLNGHLFISLLCLRHPVKAVNVALNFEACGADLASMPAEGNLSQTTPTVRHLFPEDAGIASVPTVVKVGQWIYIYAVRGSDKSLVAARISQDDLGRSRGSFELLGNDHRWSSATTVATAKQIMPSAPSEMSIRFYPHWKKWIAIYKDSEMLSDQILLRSSDSPVGPWSTASRLFSIRDVDSGARLPGVFCYAGKDHPELSLPSQLTVSFVCNALDPAALKDHGDVYVPKLIRVRLDSGLRVKDVRPFQ